MDTSNTYAIPCPSLGNDRSIAADQQVVHERFVSRLGTWTLQGLCSENFGWRRDLVQRHRTGRDAPDKWLLLECQQSLGHGNRVGWHGAYRIIPHDQWRQHLD